MNYAIILAGGSGTRFWPLSRRHLPKQFISIHSDRPMLEDTVRRIGGLIQRQNTYISTNRLYRRNLTHSLKSLKIPGKNIFFEPESKNTFPAIGVLSRIIYERDKNAVVVVLPSDHYVKKPGMFLKALRKAIAAAQNNYIITIGIKPDKPETGYGYIKRGHKLSGEGLGAYRVEKFTEKPDLKTAQKYLKNKKYFWNGGIFIFKAGALLGEIARLYPQQFNLINKVTNQAVMDRAWGKINPISIDYAIMEKTGRLAVIPADFGWEDLGSWLTVENLVKKDKQGNIFRGNYIDIGSKNTSVWAGRRLLATLGLDNIIIVDTPDATLVCSKDKTQELRKVVKILKEKKLYRLI